MKIDRKDYIMKRGGNEPDGKMYIFKELEEYGINFPIQLYVLNNISEFPDKKNLLKYFYGVDLDNE